MSDLFVRSLEFTMIAGRAVGGRGTVRFVYSQNDPHAVHFSFPHICWRVPRDVLAKDIIDRFGSNSDADDDEYEDPDVDVRVQPTRDGVEITFRRDPGGVVTCLFDRDALIDALQATWEFDVDSLIADALGEAA